MKRAGRLDEALSWAFTCTLADFPELPADTDLDIPMYALQRISQAQSPCYLSTHDFSAPLLEDEENAAV